MAERTAEEVAQIFSAAGDSVAEISKSKKSDETDNDYKNRIKRNVEHLEGIKTYKKEDGSTSIWTSEDFTDINAAITAGKAKYE
tara:strand:- start:177 stop:428 length:252 start_codon:yes stop_codon:yes gene_type:complete